MRSHGIVSDSKNRTDDRAAFAGGNPVKDFGFAFGEA
jgi:hypothetical protein